MFQHTFAILDTETTGFHYKKYDRIIEIAAVKIREGEIKEQENFVSLINPEMKIPPAATRVNNIVDSMVEDAPLFKNVLDKFFYFLSDVDYLFIHNAKFDLGFLESETKRLGRDLKLPKVVCSVELSKKFYPNFQYHNLNAIAKHLGLSIQQGEERHRALGDVLLTGEAILRFYEENALTFLGTVEQIANNKYC